MLIIGDIHGEYNQYIWLLKQKSISESIQIGDFGLGFDLSLDDMVIDYLSNNLNHKFIRGNHDDPDKCKNIPNYLGDYGYDKKNNLFYLSGGMSVDKEYRIAHQNLTGEKIWWENEQLHEEDLAMAIDLFCSKKPKIAISHECPNSVVNLVTTFSNCKGRSQTSMALKMMHDYHQPDLWIFGHYHIKKTFKNKGTEFKALDMMRNSNNKGWMHKCCIKI